MKDAVHQFLEKEYQEAKRVHQLQPLFERYKIMSEDLIEEFQADFDNSNNLVLSALYTADYIIMSSEVKFELEDSVRRQEIIDFWKKLSLPKEDSWYELTHLVAFSFKVASILRKRFYYLLDRGVAKHIAAALVSDYYTRHLLVFVREKMKYIPPWWAAFLIETALCQSIFSKSLEKWVNLRDIMESQQTGIISQIIAKHFAIETEGEPNPAVPIPYFKESTMFYYFRWQDGETKGEKFESLIPVLKTAQFAKKFKNTTKLLSGDYPHILKYIRFTNKLESITSEINLFVVHAKTATAEGWIGLLSPLDDINLKEVEALLQLKLEDIGAFEKFKKDLPQMDVFKRVKEEREIIEEKIEIEEQPKPTGFFGKLLSVFKKKKEPKIRKSTIKKAIPIDAWSRLILDEMILTSVSGIGIGEEVYDSFREDDFVISGVIESEQKQTQPTVFYSESPIQFPTEFLDPVIGILELAKRFISVSYSEKTLSIIPEEAFFENKLNPEVFRLVEFVKGEKVVIGILAEKQAKTAMIVARPEPSYQRRSLIRKANEILHARRVNNIIDSGKRTLAREIDWDKVNKSFEEKSLFFVS
ncbi:MAG: hypothetical protein KAU62_04090 [Candidatus Heimdallarchaeota archaeon]|nr:hypothetical protein [Candidatus Heimdallarchaeota archaeon]MCG3255245.1 hypothetical protein [Candidatus Heimdallarchaeota archaeon]MCK4610317.1 hypothetical protein [Candidatus Heimdallarchaeota archaeon]